MKFIVYAPPYNDESGGPVVLHRLCDRLNYYGHEAYLFPMGWHHAYKNPIRKLRSKIGETLRKLSGETFTTCAGFQTPLARKQDVADAIVIYPEIVTTNPLHARRVVRWVLYKTDYDTKTLGRMRNDLFFYFQPAFRIPRDELHCAGELQVMHLRNDIYSKTNFGSRSGTCYTLRKGKDRKIVHDLDNSVCIDGLSHRETAKVFNKTETFISYDPYTLYSQYAAMCGCTSVVVPLDNKTRDEWQPTEALRIGVAYGFDDIEWARATANQVAPLFVERERIRNESVHGLVAKCEAFFR